MMRAVLPAALLLAGCGGESTTESAARTGEVSLTNATAAQVAEQTAAASGTGAMKFDPGEWETTVELLDAQIPGMPDAVAKQVRDSMKMRTTVTSCMTPEQADRPSEEMLAGNDGNCRFDNYQMQGGRIQAAMTCQGGADEAANAKIVMDGRYTASSFDLQNSIQTRAAGMGDMTMRSRVSGKRLGDCKT